MGRSSEGENSVNSEPTNLFEGADLGRKPTKVSSLIEGATIPQTWRTPPPIQSNDKSLLIADYLKNFQRVTRGGLYIDGFAAPQSREHTSAWTARRVLEIKPPRLRRCWLCEMDPAGLLQLQELKRAHHKTYSPRHVHVMPGDFNKTVRMILQTPYMTRKTAVFVLLDQRTTECHWATVQAIAGRSGRYKIEMMYFLGVSWLHRSLKSSSTPARIAEINQWWGGDDWGDQLHLSQVDFAKMFAGRFAEELGYRFVNYYPVYQDKAASRKSFYLIHASDHPEAPKLMGRSYVRVIKDLPGLSANAQRTFDL
ncbi:MULTISPECIES: three-Cys-motif partner protein TcmP [unclassified Yoonia]|uniref:three-Cys-motif partner protein TcmP n=1 Tax=unclassified Yoonia TaxID=2629118 RepID=UPI002AFE130B|nr:MULTISPECIES: three-Cys-motif partner protein TcmP [unclassified Yoonia]